MSDFPISISREAIAQLTKILARKGSEGTLIRLGVKGGGCSGLEYVLRLDDRRLPEDLETTVDGVTIVCDAKSATYLQGSTLVYTGNLIGGGFSFENPNAKRSCGCGTSFTPIDRG
ncbi:MAG TPA: iron-sulfur cluster assembly accessory protein [Fimbriimonadaceae bacterium]|nr:iron-sulfur cluster assembly accessory protein [Fimbriimonadaceae bacterium]HRJ95916.1 iron-sulfur cluster assembly accessory protein [Fimbriimonadaceae bacterium]